MMNKRDQFLEYRDIKEESVIKKKNNCATLFSLCENLLPFFKLLFSQAGWLVPASYTLSHQVML